jgi:hypothetical protein
MLQKILAYQKPNSRAIAIALDLELLYFMVDLLCQQCDRGTLINY